MFLHAMLLTGILLNSTAARVESDNADARERYEKARQEVESARRDLSEAEARLLGLRAEQRLQSALSAAKPVPPPQRNPEFDRLQAESRSLESHVQKLSERMSAAHPELISAEAELEKSRNRLATTPEFVDLGSSAAHPDLENGLQEANVNERIAQAEDDVRRTRQNLESALKAESRALSDLLTPPKVEPVPAVEVKQEIPAEAKARNDMGWILAGITSAALLLLFIASRSRAEKSPPSIPATPVSQPAPTSRRIIYSAEEAPTPAAITTKPHRAPIVPRRRVS